MLTVYSNLIKREEVLSRIGDDIQSLANLLNDITCEIKVASAACKNKDIEASINAMNDSEQLFKAAGAMIENVKGNLTSYVEIGRAHV